MSSHAQPTVRIMNLDKVGGLVARVGKAALRGMLVGTAKAGLLVRADAISRIMRSPKEDSDNSSNGHEAYFTRPNSLLSRVKLRDKNCANW